MRHRGNSIGSGLGIVCQRLVVGCLFLVVYSAEGRRSKWQRSLGFSSALLRVISAIVPQYSTICEKLHSIALSATYASTLS